MAEAALLGVANSVLSQLSSPALKEVLLLWDFDKDLHRLHQTIQTITAFLHDAEQRESKERVVKLWLSRLRAILYDADDLFDAVVARALHKKVVSGNAFKREDGSCLDQVPWKLFQSLRTLQLISIGKLGSIPNGIQHLISLQTLEMLNCEGIKEIPNWMSNLTSLQKLHIDDCSSEIVQRCKPEVGEDWHLISHIPNINIMWNDEDGIDH